jgi:hypothetical protein
VAGQQLGISQSAPSEADAQRVPYPLSLYAKGMDGRIDDAKAGWKGRGMWTTSGDRAPWLKECGKGTVPIAFTSSSALTHSPIHGRPPRGYQQSRKCRKQAVPSLDGKGLEGRPQAVVRWDSTSVSYSRREWTPCLPAGNVERLRRDNSRKKTQGGSGWLPDIPDAAF